MDQPRKLSNLSSALASISLHNGDDYVPQNQQQQQQAYGGQPMSQYQQQQHQQQQQDDDISMSVSAPRHAMPQMQQMPMEELDKIAQYKLNYPDDGITLFSHRSAPNGFKIAVVLSELGLKYRTVFLDFKKNEQRSPAYISVNPNARVPSIIDHDNEHVSVWESGAILIYLCQKAGPDCPLWSEDVIEQSQINSWLFFQTSGHAPMVGQALHFRYFHPELIPSAIERYTNEVRRIYGVVEMRLAEKREQLILEMDDESFALGTSALSESKYFDEPVWLVGNRMTIADLAFVTWNNVVDRIGIDLKGELPEVYKWTRFMMGRPAVIRALKGQDNV
ncbi:Protein URE2 [Yarrowia lipolytica]|nr:Protein URE2 [Yarrowia lipolytica]